MTRSVHFDSKGRQVAIMVTIGSILIVLVLVWLLS